MLAQQVASELGRPRAAEVVVKKLGCEASFGSSRGRAKEGRRQLGRPIGIFANRVKKALKRVPKLTRLMHGHRSLRWGPVLRAGIQASALYGSETAPPPVQALAGLQQAAFQANGLAISCVPRSLKAVFLGPVDPVLDYVWRVVSWWHRELWARTSAWTGAEDLLTFVELAALHRKFIEDPPDFGPLAALHAALAMLGWQWVQPGKFRDDTGSVLDLCGGSPAMLRKFVLAAWQRRLLAGLIEDHPQFAGWSPRVACKLWHSRAATALNRQQKVLMLRLLAGSVLTPAKLAEWGYKVDTICPRCGREDTVEHRLLECPAGEELREPIRD